MPEEKTFVALRHAIETVRAQIPNGELTRQSVERLLEAAEAVCGAAGAGRPESIETQPGPRLSKRQEDRLKWARIAQQNAVERRRG
jgi:hypothetical protein